MQKDAQVKRKATRFTSYNSGYDSGDGEGNFHMRDLLRFLVVDIILLIVVKLFMWLGFFATPSQYVLAILGSKVLLFVYLIWLVRAHRDAWPDTGAASIGRWWAWPLCLLLYIACYPLLVHVDRLNNELLYVVKGLLGFAHIPHPQDVVVLIFEDIVAMPVRITLVAFSVLIGPFMEELAFRGMGLDAAWRSWGTFWAVLFTSLMFGVYHFSLDLMIPLVLLGIVFCLVRIISRSLWCSVLIHSLHNAIALSIVAYNAGLLDSLNIPDLLEKYGVPGLLKSLGL